MFVECLGGHEMWCLHAFRRETDDPLVLIIIVVTGYMWSNPYGRNKNMWPSLSHQTWTYRSGHGHVRAHATNNNTEYICKQLTVTAYLSSKHLLLFVFAWRFCSCTYTTWGVASKVVIMSMEKVHRSTTRFMFYLCWCRFKRLTVTHDATTTLCRGTTTTYGGGNNEWALVHV